MRDLNREIENFRIFETCFSFPFVLTAGDENDKIIPN